MQGFLQWLFAVLQVTFQHHAGDRVFAAGALLKQIMEYLWLSQWVFAAAGMAAIHDQSVVATFGLQGAHGLANAVGIVVGAMVATAQYQMGVRVAGGL